MSLPILITQISRSWIHVDEYYVVYPERILIALDRKTVPYFASLQVDWTKEMTHADIHLVPSESSKEDDDDN